MKTAVIREKFLNFFVSKGHSRVASSSLVPANDPTLLFTNAGMNQFKDVFLGFDERPYKRAVTAQKCTRAGGKHNDLENVGYTTRHLTFFEMLGNFSFGDYFKREAIAFAWEFLTSPRWLALPPARLLVTVYGDDDEAYYLWHDTIGLPADKIIRIGDNKGARYASDNFWQMGDTGPCGPCTEIFYDHGPQVFGGPPGSKEEDGDRFVEIWNCVFMQYNRDAAGNMNLLPKPSVDTGMGLERIAAVMQNVDSNFAIDLFQNLLRQAAKLTGTVFATDNSSLNVIVDHIRTGCFLIAAGIFPGNEGRSYVLRRIIRRALRHGYKLGCRDNFFYRLVPAVVAEMGTAYPELIAKEEVITRHLEAEGEKFSQTLATGLSYLKDYLSGAATVLGGEVAFKLYDTYGFPLDLTTEICRERGIKVDEAGFNAAMAGQKRQSRRAGNFKAVKQLPFTGMPTEFLGYGALSAEANIIALYDESEREVKSLAAHAKGVVVLDKTPFYAESGGQVGDVGKLTAAGVTLFTVHDCQKIKAGVNGHWGQAGDAGLKIGERVTAAVDEEYRLGAAANHTATHLLHAALRRILGLHVEQKGSLVASDRLRFDFSHNKPMTDAELCRLETEVNSMIWRNLPVTTVLTSYAEAIAGGAMALFGEKYGNQVRVVSIGDFSAELCGGTHLHHSGEIGLFKILSESGIAAGVRRIEAVTAGTALSWVQHRESIFKAAGQALKAGSDADLISKIQELVSTNKKQEKDLLSLQRQFFNELALPLVKEAKNIRGIGVIIKEFPYDAKELRDLVTITTLKQDNLLVIFYSYRAGHASLCVGISRPLTAKIAADGLINLLAATVGGHGGGRADIAQAGAAGKPDLAKLTAVTEDWLAAKNTDFT